MGRTEVIQLRGSGNLGYCSFEVLPIWVSCGISGPHSASKNMLVGGLARINFLGCEEVCV